jgi:hypothetical protein
MKSKLLTLRMLPALCVAALALTVATPSSYARKGADDPATHDVGDDHGIDDDDDDDLTDDNGVDPGGVDRQRGKSPKAPRAPRAPRAPKTEHPPGHK